jgi:hypothetical protein
MYDYELNASVQSLFARWERGERTTPPAPLATRSRHYRRLIVKIIQNLLPISNGTLISLGAGNGFAETALTAAGFKVLATDISDTALLFCQAKGLAVRQIDVSCDFPMDIGTFDALYADGLLGHIYDDNGQVATLWTRMSSLLNRSGVAVFSNDLSDHDDCPNWTVRGHPSWSFYRPPKDTFSTDAVNSGHWACIGSCILRYRRPERGLRRRELLALARRY